MTRYEFQAPSLQISVTSPAIEGGIGVRIEHVSGAALLVRSMEPTETPRGLEVTIMGFDGRAFEVVVAGDWSWVEVRTATPSPILGDDRFVRASRTTPGGATLRTPRSTGDETTAPISFDDK